MTKISRKKLDPEIFGEYINNLWSAFTLMDSKDHIRLLFKDLLTHTEYKMFAKRLEVARRLIENQTYECIEKDLKVTPGTIAKINNILNNNGQGLIHAHHKLLYMENKLLKEQREHQKNLENPFRRKAQRHTVLGEGVKAGIRTLDKFVSKKLKERTAKRTLTI
jgi:uncharacterized protein YerC